MADTKGMAHAAKNTEHNGAKKGRGGYWGRKADAKRESNRARRTNDRIATRDRD